MFALRLAVNLFIRRDVYRGEAANRFGLSNARTTIIRTDGFVGRQLFTFRVTGADRGYY